MEPFVMQQLITKTQNPEQLLCQALKAEIERLGSGWNTPNNNSELCYFEPLVDYLKNPDNKGWEQDFSSDILLNLWQPNAIVMWIGDCDFYPSLLSYEDALATYKNLVKLPDNASFDQIDSAIELTLWSKKQ